MFSAIRRRMRVSPTTVIATFALVFAMTGGAYAASRYLITSTKQISPKVLKALQGKAGAAGASGAQGPAGPAGAGSVGPQGPAGNAGTNGTSVTSKTLAKGEGSCKEGGSEFTSASGKTTACNGEKGKEGTFGGQSLPAGKTLTGSWAAASYAAAAFGEEGTGIAATGVSFALPVSPGLKQQHYIGPEEGENREESKWAPAIKEHECKGDAEKPGAAEGNLCVFGGENEINLLSSPGIALNGNAETTPGFTIVAFGKAKGSILMEGTWAVTAE
jgi:hypothetical protein